jgi:hypothetical protein
MPRFLSLGQWEEAAVVADTLSAEALIGLLVSEGVTARLQSDTALLGAARQCRILVPRDMIQRARCVLWQTRFSDEELAALAEETDAPPWDGRERR